VIVQEHIPQTVMHTPLPPELVEDLITRLLAGEHYALLDYARVLSVEGWIFPEIAAELIVPLQIELGERWASGRSTVAHEHVITALCQQTVSVLRAAIPAPDSATAPVAVVGCGRDERHALGAEIVAGTLQTFGWRVIYVGADTPPEGMIAIIEEWMAELVAISVTTPSAVPEAVELISWIKDKHPEKRVVVGGQAALLRFFPEADVVAGTDLQELITILHTWRP
jgi:methanogenic corrinoid protein MtbC1